jgi:hypothetical protein
LSKAIAASPDCFLVTVHAKGMFSCLVSKENNRYEGGKIWTGGGVTHVVLEDMGGNDWMFIGTYTARSDDASGGIPVVDLLTRPAMNSDSLAELSAEENAAISEAVATGNPFAVRFFMPANAEGTSTIEANALVTKSRTYGDYMVYGIFGTKYAMMIKDPGSGTWGFGMIDMSMLEET